MDKKTKAKKTIPDTICRVHRSGGYAVLSNCFVRSTNIGCDSIGLLGKINDLPPTWNFTIAGLVAICEDGETAIKSQLAELEQWGYVKKTLLMPNESPTGRISYLYDFYEYSELDDSIPKYDIEMETFTADNATLNRVKKDSNFTIISAKLLRTNKIRNKLIGFMLKVLSLPNSWNFSMSGLKAICKEGKAEKLLYTAYIALIFAMYPEDQWNFETLIDMINNSECREDDEEFKNAIDIEFEIVECWLNGTKHEDPEVMADYGDIFETKPDAEQRRLGAFALKQFKAYKLAAGKTAKSILISCSTRLAPFAIDEVLEITSYDELHLDRLGDELSALFIIISDTDATFNFLVAIMYSQLFNLLCTKADNSPGGKLTYHVRCLLDEFANSVTRSVLKRYGT